MIYKYNDKYIVLSENVVNRISHYKQNEPTAHEAGGILLGKVFDDTIYIDAISEPSSEDESGRNYFYRNVEKAQNIVEYAWRESNGERIYLGEWHTHPEKVPKPSIDDKKLIANMLEHSKMEIDFLIMVIAGTFGYFVGVDDGSEGLTQLPKLDPNEGINTKIFYENRSIYGFQITGYDNYAQLGYDIFNASLSTISTGTINAILVLTPIKDYELITTQGFIKFLIRNVLDEVYYNDIRLLLESMVIQLEMLKNEIECKTSIPLKIEKIL